MPSIDALMIVDDEDELLNLSAVQGGDPKKICCLKVIPLTPLLLAAMSKVEDPMNMILIYFAYKDSIDELVADGFESAPMDLKISLQFLWLMVHDPIPLDIPWNLVLLPAQEEDPFIICKYALIKKALFPALTIGKGTVPAASVASEDATMRELMGRMVSLQEQQLHLSGKLTKCSSMAIEDRSSSKKWTHLLVANQKMIRFMSKPCLFRG